MAACQWLGAALQRAARATPEGRELGAFWLLGLLCNIGYVIMLACAAELAAGAVGAVYLCAILPSLLVKLSGPYWFHLATYRTRMHAVAASMALAFCAVALGRTMGQQLLGVAVASFQGGLGEFSVLQLCSRTSSSRRTLTAWSSGTGFAGIAGYAWVVVLHRWLGCSFRATLLLANIVPLAWLRICYALLEEQQPAPAYAQLSGSGSGAEDPPPGPDEGAASAAGPGGPLPPPHQQQQPDQPPGESPSASLLPGQPPGSSASSRSASPEHKLRLDGCAGPATTAAQKLRHTLALWPYTGPLFLVYFAEYAMQAGCWSAIGFPVDSIAARAAFYGYANWVYQCGVFASRSSGGLLQAGRRALWAMSFLQCALLLFFVLDAAVHWWYNYGLLLACFGAGLLGGAVYVNAFTLLAREVVPPLREFSLGAASLGDSLGIACADAAAVMIQGCLYRVNGLAGAAFSCRG
jgi:battenin